MEPKTEGESEAKANKFWGAIKIFTEKPHVINRRICGTINLWIGICEEKNYDLKEVLNSVLDAIESDDGTQKKSEIKVSKDENSFDESSCRADYDDVDAIKSCASNKKEYDVQESSQESLTGNSKADKNIKTDEKLPLIKETMNTLMSVLQRDNTSQEYSGIDCEDAERSGEYHAVTHMNLSLIQKKLEDCCFKSLSKDDLLKLQEGCETSENGNSNAKICNVEATTESDCASNLQDETFNDDNDEGETSSKNHHQNPSSDSQKGRLTIPWGYLRKTSNTIAVIRQILPKQANKFTTALEVILLDGEKKEATYITNTKSSHPSVNPKVNYTVSLTPSGMNLSALCCAEGDLECASSVMWLMSNVLPKLTKWQSEVSGDGTVHDGGSLTLVDVAEYSELYQRLKTKYGKPLEKIWTEVTDPKKHVYEDIAIATYLILLWKQERHQKNLSQPQSFVDLGCGNGLLVHILSGEGHKGLGVDLKKRKIWDMLPGHVELKESVIEPSDKNLFPEHDWLIGNHSDELTPWIPVIAAKSGHHSRFFLIPCCSHDFSQKYRRRHAGRSPYADYLEYVKEIGGVCGFKVRQDKLRIPSTKRICLIGDARTVDSSDYGKLFQTIDSFIKERTEATKQPVNEAPVKSNPLMKKEQSDLQSEGVWSEVFKARESVQPVRNCTQLKRSVKEDIISAIVGVLMEKKHLVEVDIGDQTTVTWDRGGSMTLPDLAGRLDHPLRAAMKSECGGLQTLLKNHRYIFNLSGGLVSLQVPQPAWKKKETPNTFTKTKLCWFHTHHRCGCPLPSEVCLFAHGEGDLKGKDS